MLQLYRQLYGKILMKNVREVEGTRTTLESATEMITWHAASVFPKRIANETASILKNSCRPKLSEPIISIVVEFSRITDVELRNLFCNDQEENEEVYLMKQNMIIRKFTDEILDENNVVEKLCEKLRRKMERKLDEVRECLLGEVWKYRAPGITDINIVKYAIERIEKELKENFPGYSVSCKTMIRWRDDEENSEEEIIWITPVSLKIEMKNIVS